MIRTLLKQSSIYFAGLVLSKVLTVLLFILLARFLGPVEFGKYIFFLTLLQLITVISDLGLIQWYQTEAHSREVKELVHAVIPIRTLTLFTSLFITFIAVWVTGTLTTEVAFLLVLIMIPEAYLSVLDGFYFHARKSYLVALKTAVEAAIMIIGVIVLKDKLQFQTVVYLYLATSTTSLIWYVPWKLLKDIRIPPFHTQIRVLKSSIKYAYLIFTSFAYARGDSLIIKALRGDAAVGMYGASYRFLESLSLLPTAMSHNLFPVSSKEGNVSSKDLKGIVAVMAVAGGIVGAALWICADFLILILVGREYTPAIPVLYIFSVVVVLFFVSAPLSTVVQSSRFVTKFLPWGVANTAANILLNLIVVPIFGIMGAAYVMLFTEITGLIINLWFVKKLYA